MLCPTLNRRFGPIAEVQARILNRIDTEFDRGANSLIPLVLSALQALVFQHWLAASRRDR